MERYSGLNCFFMGPETLTGSNNMFTCASCRVCMEDGSQPGYHDAGEPWYRGGRARFELMARRRREQHLMLSRLPSRRERLQ